MHALSVFHFMYARFGYKKTKSSDSGYNEWK